MIRTRGITVGLGLLLVAILASVYAVALPHAEAAGGTGLQSGSIVVNGTTRTYDYYVPQSMGPSTPLVIVLHGHTQTVAQVMGQTNVTEPASVWRQVAESQHIMLAVPQGLVGPDGKTGWNDCRADATDDPSSDDVAFISSLIDTLESQYPNIDPTRIYATGASNGGFMAQRLGIELPNRIAAVGAVISAVAADSQCAQPSPKPILYMNGTADPILPWGGGTVADGHGTALSASSSVDSWVSLDGADPTPTVAQLANINTKDHSTVTKYTYSSASSSDEVVLYQVIGGGHTEPSITQLISNFSQLILGYQNRDIEMANEIWNFFSTKSL